MEPELSSSLNPVSELVIPLLEPKNLRKSDFELGQKKHFFKIGDRVTNLQSQIGTVIGFQTHTTPNGIKVPQAMVDFGAKKKWTDLVVLKLSDQI